MSPLPSCLPSCCPASPPRLPGVFFCSFGATVTWTLRRQDHFSQFRCPEAASPLISSSLHTSTSFLRRLIPLLRATFSTSSIRRTASSCRNCVSFVEILSLSLSHPPPPFSVFPALPPPSTKAPELTTQLPAPDCAARRTRHPNSSHLRQVLTPSPLGPHIHPFSPHTLRQWRLSTPL